jgi:hypothetical protein
MKNKIINNMTDPEEMLVKFKPIYDKIDFTEQKSSDNRYYFGNGMFAYGDGVFYTCMLYEYKPNKIIEVGSGFTSALLLDIVDKVQDWSPEITFIEPAPERLNSLLRDDDRSNVTIIKSTLQQVNYDIFKSLNSGDLLFIDSSHYYRAGSDVYDVLNSILPNLNSGVIVHFHDIFYPWEQYPQAWLCRKYTEMPALVNFLQSNHSDWNILFYNNYTNQEYKDKVAELLPSRLAKGCHQRNGGSIYIQKL